MTDDQINKLGEAIDRVDNCAHGLQIPFDNAIHVNNLRELLPEIVVELKAAFVEVTGQNPWES